MTVGKGWGAQPTGTRCAEWRAHISEMREREPGPLHRNAIRPSRIARVFRSGLEGQLTRPYPLRLRHDFAAGARGFRSLRNFFSTTPAWASN